ncbi:MAG: flagellar biosynthesis protein FlhF, partial [Gammaproteobacteria bacterium]
VALVTMDNYRIGAHEQLRTYGKLLGVPVHIAGDREELKTILNHLHDRKLVLIDTAGASQRDMRLTEQLATLDVDGVAIRRCLVLSATGLMDLHDEVIRSFSRVAPDSCILTKIDEATSLGGVLSVLMKHHLPVTYLSDGQRVPDDFHQASARHLVTQAAALTKCTESGEPDEVWLQAFAAQEAGTHADAHI